MFIKLTVFYSIDIQRLFSGRSCIEYIFSSKFVFFNVPQKFTLTLFQYSRSHFPLTILNVLRLQLEKNVSLNQHARVTVFRSQMIEHEFTRRDEETFDLFNLNCIELIRIFIVHCYQY